jgi:hypothetical protein
MFETSLAYTARPCLKKENYLLFWVKFGEYFHGVWRIFNMEKLCGI